MNWTADDFVIGVLLVGILLVIVAIIAGHAYRTIWAQAFSAGEIRERLRWHEAGVDARLEEEETSGVSWPSRID